MMNFGFIRWNIYCYFGFTACRDDAIIVKYP